MKDVDAYESEYENQWCPGCGNFGILEAMKIALAESGIAPHEVLIVSGIGQAAKAPHFLECNFFHSLHGRALPLATGAKIANHDLKIIVNTGDGDCFAEGGNHFIHAIRRNVDLTVLAHDNAVYGLTKGQASPTAGHGMVTRLQKDGVASQPLKPLALSLAAGAGFVARGFSGYKAHLSRLIQAALQFKGFSLIDILQPCVSFNRINTYAWYKERVYEIDALEHDPGNFSRAMNLAFEWEERIPVGILYRSEKPSFTSQLKRLDQGTLIDASSTKEKIAVLLRG
jgi:2-oxoglutarate/2-oxoacid ferredoxin oxidoreductase subunit beta